LKLGGQALPMPMDIRHESSVKEAVANAADAFGGTMPRVFCFGSNLILKLFNISFVSRN
jgi:hypothetical protein